MVVASQLLSLLAKGGEEPAEPLGRRSRVELFIASEDDVGVDLAREHLPRVHIHRVCGGHREILRGRSAGDLQSSLATRGRCALRARRLCAPLPESG